MIISFEKIEALRALPYLKKGGKLITDDREIFPMPVLTGAAEYPHETIDELKKVVPDVMVIKAADVAEELGNIRAQNIVLLGAFVKAMGLTDKADWRQLVADYVPAKARDLNLAAFDAGFAM